MRIRSLARPLSATVCATLLGLGALSPSSAAPSDPASATARTPTTATPLRAFVDVRDVAPSILHDIRYRTRHNFVGRPIAAYEEPRCLLSRAAAGRLAEAQAAALRQGYSLKVYDCYRPQSAVDDFVAWSGTSSETMKREFYPKIAKDRLFADGYIARRSGHSRGSTVDLTLVRLPAATQRAWQPSDGLQPCYWPRWARYRDSSIDMGTGYDCFDTRSHTASPDITSAQRGNRQRLLTLMEDAGFTNYDQEWWHYTLDDEPFPSTYFDVPVARSSVR